MEVDGRLRVYGASGGRPLLDVCPEDIDWPDGEQKILNVEDMLHMINMDPYYCRICPIAQPSIMNPVIYEGEQLVWGSTYQVVKERCPRCTLCGSSCTRKKVQHVLCCHDITMSCVTLWHDLRKRSSSNSTRCCGLLVGIQGYADGLGLETELRDEEIVEEINQIVSEKGLNDANSVDENRHRLTCLLAWQGRAVSGGLSQVVRQAVMAAIDDHVEEAVRVLGRRILEGRWPWT